MRLTRIGKAEANAGRRERRGGKGACKYLSRDSCISASSLIAMGVEPEGGRLLIDSGSGVGGTIEVGSLFVERRAGSIGVEIIEVIEVIEVVEEGFGSEEVERVELEVAVGSFERASGRVAREPRARPEAGRTHL